MLRRLWRRVSGQEKLDQMQAQHRAFMCQMLQVRREIALAFVDGAERSALLREIARMEEELGPHG